jgi:hypothetical protein
MEYDSSTKKNETMVLLGEWMQLEIIKFNKTGHAQKEKTMYFFVHHMLNLDLKI